MKPPCALTIAGSDSGGGAGIQADLKTFSALGVHGLCVVTAVTAQNTQGVRSLFKLPPEFVREQLEVLLQDFEVEWAKTGMLASPEIIEEVGRAVREHGLRLVVDPVLTAGTGEPLLEDGLEALKGLISSAELVTPNLGEAEELSGVKIQSLKDMRRAARAIAKLGPAVLIKGGHLKTRRVHDVLFFKGKFWEFRGARVEGGERVHGSGCSFSAAIVAEASKGASLPEAIERARGFVSKGLERGLEVGKGARVMNPLAELYLDSERWRATQSVWRGAQMLVDEPGFAKLVPEVGSNLAMAPLGAKSPSEVVGLSGRIILVEGKPKLTGFPMLGGSEHVANLVLTAMRHDPRVRAGLNIKFSRAILGACRRLGLRISSFSRREEPRGVKTLVWGTERAIEKLGEVPDVIYDEGALGKEPMIRLLGPSAEEVAQLALRVAEGLG